MALSATNDLKINGVTWMQTWKSGVVAGVLLSTKKMSRDSKCLHRPIAKSFHLIE